MFFSIFWTAFIPVGMIILALAGERLMHPAPRACLDCLFELAPNQARARRTALKRFWVTQCLSL